MHGANIMTHMYIYTYAHGLYGSFTCDDVLYAMRIFDTKCNLMYQLRNKRPIVKCIYTHVYFIFTQA